jgi:hypothetical protein
MRRSSILLLAGVCAWPALAQSAAPAPPAVAGVQAVEPVDDSIDADEDSSDEAIFVVGQRARGSVIGDIPPENQLTSRDIRATGATSISELLDAIAPQIGSARGRGGEAPVLLLNGRRISGFRELRDVPPEAIERVDILPEEVALKYGYRADQRVVNFVLRRRFFSTVARADGALATEGGYAGGLADMTRLTINRDRRTTFNIHGEANSRLDEDERDIDLQDTAGFDTRPYRSLVGSRQLVRGSATHSRTIFGDVAATLNGELEHSEGQSGLGFEAVPLLRDSSSDSAHLGLALNQDRGPWKYSLTGNADWVRSITLSDRGAGTTDRSRSTRTSADLAGTASGPVVTLPAGRANLTAKLAVNTLDVDNRRRRGGVNLSNALARDVVDASFSLDVPILKDSPIGRLGANANAGLEHFSDFGTLTAYGAGLNWTPVERLNLIASWTREEGAPSVQQVGDPVLDTPDTRVFDFTTGETVLGTAVSGGNPGLDADRRNVLKLGANWKPFADKDLRLRADFVHSVIKDPISGFPGPSAELEEAFPERFVRDSGGSLVAVDFRPVNFQESRRDTLRWGFDFSRPLKSARPSPSQIEQMRARFRPPQGSRPPEGGQPAGVGAARPPEGSQGAGPGSGGFRGGGGFGGRGGGGFFGGGQNRGRLTLSVTHTVTLADEATIADGLKLDYLHGAALNNSGGRARHQVEVQAGWSNNGLGARLVGNWRSGTRVEGGANGDLRFAPLATVDLRLFANLGERFDLVSKHPWLIGSSVRLEVDNLLDSKPRVRDAAGEVPFSYQQDLLDPRGRTVTVSVRKLFLPQRFRARSSASSTTR